MKINKNIFKVRVKTGKKEKKSASSRRCFPLLAWGQIFPSNHTPSWLADSEGRRGRGGTWAKMRRGKGGIGRWGERERERMRGERTLTSHIGSLSYILNLYK